MASNKKSDRDMTHLKKTANLVEEPMRIRLDDVLNRFQQDAAMTDYTFPVDLTSIERAYVHQQCISRGLKSESAGTVNRRITVTKQNGSNAIVSKRLKLSAKSCAAVQSIYFLRSSEQRMFPHSRGLLAIENGAAAGGLGTRLSTGKDFSNRVSTGPFPQVPTERRTQKYETARQRLPIWHHREEILHKISAHKVVFIKGDTGSGKTTQVPQFILDDATTHKKKVRILCTVPRRIAAVSICDRVATERGERVGGTVGYQIRLESCFSPCDTLLTYCTSGILLRSLTSYDYSVLKNTTHIILDEVHERDRQTDFLLACIRDLGHHFPNLKLILMGADMDNRLLTSYFGGPQYCPMIQVKGQLFPVKIWFLENVLKMLNYNNQGMKRTEKKTAGKHESNVKSNLVSTLLNGSQVFKNGSSSNHTRSSSWTANDGIEPDTIGDLNDEDINLVDEMIHNVWINGDDYSYVAFMELAMANKIPIDHQHKEFSFTMLMAVCVQGHIQRVAELLTHGADTTLSVFLPKYGKSMTAKDWAQDHDENDIVELLSQHEYSRLLSRCSPASITNDPSTKEILQNYLTSIDEDRVDLPLILTLLHTIHRESDLSSAVLVFLPGYEEIVTLWHMLFSAPEFRNHSDQILVFLLHSNIQTGDQRAAFDRPRRGVRKIVLSTNIAETSLTIEDVVYVIDSGKVKEKSYDVMTGITQLKSNWISKASANQRQGRAGRCRAGICYRLYSADRYQSMAEFPTPEIIRTSLQELCLYARSFIRGELKIGDFFNRLPEPPAPIAVKKAVDILKAMEAIDENEHMTYLGMYLLDLPVEPSLGKALIFAVILSCLDPILTIISMISYRDPFQLPADPSEKKRAMKAKVDFASGSMSDHMAALKAFQAWEKSKLFRDDATQNFCRNQFVSSATFEMVYGIRSQLLGQLRACRFIASKGVGDLQDINANSDNAAVVKAILAATLYPNIAAVNRQKKCLFNDYEKNITFHPSSTVVYEREGGISSLSLDWVMYDEMCQQGPKRMVRGCTCVGDLAVALFTGSCNVSPAIHSAGDVSGTACGNEMLRFDMEQLFRIDINPWISFKGTKGTLESVLFLRTHLYDLIMKKLKSPPYTFNESENTVLQTIASILLYEDQEVGLENVDGIGQWPKLVSGNLMSAPRTGFERRQAVLADSDDE